MQLLLVFLTLLGVDGKLGEQVLGRIDVSQALDAGLSSRTSRARMKARTAIASLRPRRLNSSLSIIRSSRSSGLLAIALTSDIAAVRYSQIGRAHV